jgi:hypothetical protein
MNIKKEEHLVEQQLIIKVLQELELPQTFQITSKEY